MRDYDDGPDFADPGGKSALRASSKRNPRNLPCPNCGKKNRLTPADRALGYQCDACADRAEGGYGSCSAEEMADDLKYHVCPRGERYQQFDGHGIFLTYTCDKCHDAKMSTYRSDIRERYECDEPIEPEDY